jgi:hypothetical protein
LRDLRPYICTYENCKDADQQYDSLRDWINHEAVMHQNKSGVAFGRKEGLGSPEFRECPFCFKDADTHHIATHLRRVACFSLPRFIGEDDVSAGDSEMSNKGEVRSEDTMISQTNYESSVGETGSAPEAENISSNDATAFTLRDVNQQTKEISDLSGSGLPILELLNARRLLQKNLEVHTNSEEISHTLYDRDLDQAFYPGFDSKNIDKTKMQEESKALFMSLTRDDKEAMAESGKLTREDQDEILTAYQLNLNHQNVNYARVNSESHSAEAAEAAEAVAQDEALSKGKKDIKFKDAVGRKFTFPFELVQTWRVCLPHPFWCCMKKN